MADEQNQDSAGDDRDSMDDVTRVRRVDSVGMVMTPIHRELAPPKPAKPERQGIMLTLKPFSPKGPAAAMSTMSDLTGQYSPKETKDIARVRHRHFSARPQPATVTEASSTASAESEAGKGEEAAKAKGSKKA